MRGALIILALLAPATAVAGTVQGKPSTVLVRVLPGGKLQGTNTPPRTSVRATTQPTTGRTTVTVEYQ